MTSADHHEVERAYAVDDDVELPDFTALSSVDHVDPPRVDELTAIYHDTADLALVRAGVTLRRRTGGPDEGWHLKVPAADGRDEVHRPLGRIDEVPEALARLVWGWTRGRSLAPVATVRTTRTTTLLRDADGQVPAEVCDDVVVGTPADAGPATDWREVEVELVGAGPPLLDETDELLAAVGILPRTEQRKIATVLGHRLVTAEHPRATKRRPAARLLRARLEELHADLLGHDCDVRRGVDDGVHQLRVACRRLRGLLASYRPAFDAGVSEPLRAELRWVARTLGDGRDAEVVRDRLLDLVAAESRTLVRGPVRRRIQRHYAVRLREADRHAASVLTSRRYLRLLARLESFVEAPPWTPAAEAPARDLLLRRVRRDRARLVERFALAEAVAAVDDAVGPAYDEALHDVRKAAKRLRYALETLEPVWGEEAQVLRRRVQEITRVLGERQDSAVGRAELLRLAREAAAAGEPSFTYGVLHGREESAAAQALDALVPVWAAAGDRAARAWLRKR